MEIPAAAGELRETGLKHELNSLFHRACSVYFHSISTVFLLYFISVLLRLHHLNTFSIQEFQFP